MAKADQTHRARIVKGKNFDHSILRQDVQLVIVPNTGQKRPISHADAVAMVEAKAASVLSRWAIAEIVDGKHIRRAGGQ